MEIVANWIQYFTKIISNKIKEKKIIIKYNKYGWTARN